MFLDMKIDFSEYFNKQNRIGFVNLLAAENLGFGARRVMVLSHKGIWMLVSDWDVFKRQAVYVFLINILWL